MQGIRNELYGPGMHGHGEDYDNINVQVSGMIARYFIDLFNIGNERAIGSIHLLRSCL